MIDRKGTPMMRLWNIPAVTLVLGSLLYCVPASARTWTDSTGKYKIDGEFVRLADGQVDIRRADGKLVRIPVDKLSDEDREAGAAANEASRRGESLRRCRR